MKIILSILIPSLIFFGCSKKASDPVYTVNTTTEIMQQLGETMAAIDEVGGTASGDITKSDYHNYEKSFSRLAPEEKIINTHPIMSSLVPAAEANSCSNFYYGACDTILFKKIKNLTGCSTIAGGTISGAVTLIFSGTGQATCTMPATADGVIRTANIGINGLRGAIFGIQNLTTAGQSVSRTSTTTYTFNDSGTSRQFTDPSNTKLLDLTSSTSGTMVITGANRNTRTISGGDISIKNNLNLVTCNFTPTGVTWGNTCNCPTAGTLSATCSDSTSLSLAFTSTCGAATLTQGVSTTSTVVLDRCE